METCKIQVTSIATGFCESVRVCPSKRSARLGSYTRLTENRMFFDFRGNIPENKVEHGEQVMDYLSPIPPRGVGYYRYVFVLYRQSQRLDYTEYKKAQPW